MKLNSQLHPELERWFRKRWPDGFSEAQRLALPHTLAGANTLILAPTGSGKTLAAFLSVLSDLASRATLPNKTLAVYVSPLRSLTRDIERNLAPPLAALGDRIRMEVRTGDTDLATRARQSRLRPHLLLTTPESLSSLLSQTAWRDGFDCATAIVDEIHAFAESKRGSLLALTLERLAPKQRIGLSATAAPVEAVVRLLCGERECAVAHVDGRKAHRLEVAPIPLDMPLPVSGYSPFRIAHAVAEEVRGAKCSLVFTSTRSSAEQLGLALKVLLPEFEDRIEVHHASVEREARLAVEQGLSEGRYKAVVCSSSLEMGVDFQAVDRVLLIGAPRGVSRALQRLGRSGHRLGGTAVGSLVPLSLPDLLECIALREAARQGRLDALRMPRAPLDVLAQALLGMAVEREWGIEEAFDLVRRAGPYRDLSRADFDSVLDYLAGQGKVLAGYGEAFGKIRLRDAKFTVATRKIARAYYQNIGTISDDFQVKVVARNRHLGRVEESFLASLERGDAFVIGGKSVRIRTLAGDTAMVEPAQGERVKTPSWMGGKMSLTARLASEELHLRRVLRESKDVEAALVDRYRVDPVTAKRAAAYVERQKRAASVPVDCPVQVERVRRDRALLSIFHVVAGRAVNRALAWVTGCRLGDAHGSVVSNYDDHGFLLSCGAKSAPSLDRLRECFSPVGWLGDLRKAIEGTELLGRKFRPIAETAHLMERRKTGGAARRQSSWNGSLLYQTFLKHEPDHPLVREAVREVLEDELDGERAAAEAKRIFESPWESIDLDKPSPFSLTMFASHNREVLLAQDPDKALDELVMDLYEQW
ncbi:MAG: DEAD/DEAH box helicase [Bryobacteraceae bacterium]|nr:DEAD/DEAH box helicase [Bryobacteraceae bacterium]